jgi:hypothetical protein
MTQLGTPGQGDEGGNPVGEWQWGSLEYHIKNWDDTRCQWLTPVILAIQEAKIRRIVVQN